MHARYRVLGPLVVAAAATILIAERPGEIAEMIVPVEVTPVDADEQLPAHGVRPAPALTSEWMQEIHQTLDAEKVTLAALQPRLDGADHEQALEAQREVERVKQQTELRILEIQAEHARRAGRAEQPDVIEQSNHDINPTSSPRSVPVERIGQ